MILDGLYACVDGRGDSEAPRGRRRAPDLTAIHADEEAWGYCTEFVVAGFYGRREDSRSTSTRIGKSVLVIADDDLVNVHVHTQDPGAPLSYAGGFGRLSGVKIEDMEAQVRVPDGGRTATGARHPANVGVVAASRGAGNRALFE